MTWGGHMGTTAKPTRDNRTITVDFKNEATYFQLLGDGSHADKRGSKRGSRNKRTGNVDPCGDSQNRGRKQRDTVGEP